MHTKRNPKITAQIHKVKKLRANINKRIKLFTSFKNITQLLPVYMEIGINKTSQSQLKQNAKVQEAVDLFDDVFHDGAQCRLVNNLRYEARILHLVDNFLREVPYAKVEKQNAARFAGNNIRACNGIKSMSSDEYEAFELSCGISSYVESALESSVDDWLTSKEKPASFDANGSPVTE